MRKCDPDQILGIEKFRKKIRLKLSPKRHFRIKMLLAGDGIFEHPENLTKIPLKLLSKVLDSGLYK
jgi:hypothetical protein